MSKYQSPFHSGSDSIYNATLNFQDDMSYGYTEGYICASKILTDYVVDGIPEERYPSSSPDILIYPILFLYRHHLEIRFKEIIKVGKSLLKEHPDYNDGHKLSPIWDEAKQKITNVLTINSQNISAEFNTKLIFVTKAVDDIESNDPTCDGFRYSERSKQRNATSRSKNIPNISYVDIKIHQTNVEYITDFLDEVDSLFEEYVYEY
jgi:hypothetical protein